MCDSTASPSLSSFHFIRQAFRSLFHSYRIPYFRIFRTSNIMQFRSSMLFPLCVLPIIVLSLLPAALADADGFTEAFDPRNSSFYVPQSSKTFVPIKNQAFFLGYADNTHLKVPRAPFLRGESATDDRLRAFKERTFCSWASTLRLPNLVASPTAIRQVQR